MTHKRNFENTNKGLNEWESETDEEIRQSELAASESFKLDDERAKLRQERNTNFLRMQVLRELNGHSTDSR